MLHDRPAATNAPRVGREGEQPRGAMDTGARGSSISGMCTHAQQRPNALNAREHLLLATRQNTPTPPPPGDPAAGGWRLTSTLTSFSPYTALPGFMLMVHSASSLPCAMNTPGKRCGSTTTLAPPLILRVARTHRHTHTQDGCEVACAAAPVRAPRPHRAPPSPPPPRCATHPAPPPRPPPRPPRPPPRGPPRPRPPAPPRPPKPPPRPPPPKPPRAPPPKPPRAPPKPPRPPPAAHPTARGNEKGGLRDTARPPVGYATHLRRRGRPQSRHRGRHHQNLRDAGKKRPRVSSRQ
jgi:hypothetical protein